MSDASVRKMVLNRTFRLITTKGHTIAFVKGEPVYVPPMVQAEALAIGATFEDGSIPEISEEPPKSGRPADPTKATEAIKEAILLLVTQNAREDFAASGAPKAEAVSRLVGFDVNKKEAAAVWAIINAEQAQ